MKVWSLSRIKFHAAVKAADQTAAALPVRDLIALPIGTHPMDEIWWVGHAEVHRTVWDRSENFERCSKVQMRSRVLYPAGAASDRHDDLAYGQTAVFSGSRRGWA